MATKRWRASAGRRHATVLYQADVIAFSSTSVHSGAIISWLWVNNLVALRTSDSVFLLMYMGRASVMEKVQE